MRNELSDYDWTAHQPDAAEKNRMGSGAETTVALLPPSPARCKASANLAPALGRQDHTTSPSARAAFVFRKPSRPPHLTATFVTIATRPSFAVRRAKLNP